MFHTGEALKRRSCLMLRGQIYSYLPLQTASRSLHLLSLGSMSFEHHANLSCALESGRPMVLGSDTITRVELVFSSEACGFKDKSGTSLLELWA